jgi:hypothetical protein
VPAGADRRRRVVGRRSHRAASPAATPGRAPSSSLAPPLMRRRPLTPPLHVQARHPRGELGGDLVGDGVGRGGPVLHADPLVAVAADQHHLVAGGSRRHRTRRAAGPCTPSRRSAVASADQHVDGVGQRPRDPVGVADRHGREPAVGRRPPAVPVGGGVPASTRLANDTASAAAAPGEPDHPGVDLRGRRQPVHRDPDPDQVVAGRRVARSPRCWRRARCVGSMPCAAAPRAPARSGRAARGGRLGRLVGTRQVGEQALDLDPSRRRARRGRASRSVGGIPTRPMPVSTLTWTATGPRCARPASSSAARNRASRQPG